MPETELARCPRTYEQTVASWEALLDSHFRQEGETGGGKIHLRFASPGPGTDPDMVAFIKGSVAIESAVASVADLVVLEHDFRVTFQSCGAANAFYSLDTGDVTLCYELVNYFGQLIATDIKAR